MNGKNKCKLLKEIRKQIAAQNDIDYVTSECKYKGACSGTCPKCEAEVRYLEEQLSARRNAGKAVAVAGIAAALMVTSTGCDMPNIFNSATDGKAPYITSKETAPPDKVPYDTQNTDIAELEGWFLPQEEPELMGDVPEETTQPTGEPTEPDEIVIKGMIAAPTEE